MSRYRKIPDQLWTDARFIQLPRPKPSAHYLYIYLLAGPNATALPGASRVGEAGLAEELSWPLKAFRTCFSELQQRNLAESDWRNRIAYLPGVAVDNRPESHLSVKAWQKAFNELPNCDFKVRIFIQTRSFLEGLDESLAEGKRKGFTRSFLEGLDESFLKGTMRSLGGNREQGTGNREQSLFPIPVSNPESPSVPKQHVRERTDFQKFWGPVEKHLRKSMVDEAFAQQYAGIRILEMTSQEVVLAVPSTFLSSHNGSAIPLMTTLIRDSQVDLLRGRELRLKCIDDIVAGGLE